MAYWFIDSKTNISSNTPPHPTFKKVEPYLVKHPNQFGADQREQAKLISASAAAAAAAAAAAGTAPTPPSGSVDEIGEYEDALEFFNNGDIIIRFGENGKATSPTGGTYFLKGAENETGNVIPHCGDIRINIKQVETKSGDAIGAVAIQKLYFNLVRDLWFDLEGMPASNKAQNMKKFAYVYAAHALARGDRGLCETLFEDYASDVPKTALPGLPSQPSQPNCADLAQPEWRADVISKEQSKIEPLLDIIHTTFAAKNEEIQMTEDILKRGWAGAGIWYNTISRLNGSYMDAVQDIPTLDQYPRIMKYVRQKIQESEKVVEAKNQFCPNHAGEISVPFEGQNAEDEEVAEALCEVHKYWNTGHKNPLNIENFLSKDTFSDVMHFIFGTRTLQDMTKEGIETHPLSQLAMLGKGLVDASIRNIATSSVGGAIGGLATAFDGVIPALTQPMMSLVLSTAFIGLTAGLVLYYIVPFLPFIYFFFAVASWIKSIFEAMVGVPLWALAHLRIDGEGLPGISAANGYFLILEIFLRPILTVFGLIAATLIFTAQVRVLNFLWQIVTENLSGFNNSDATIALAKEGFLAFNRGIIDEFFFTIIYAIIVYMMAIAAFKLIDKIPDNLLRWMGSSVSSFGDINQDSVDGLTRYAALGGATAGQRLAEGSQQLAQQSGTQLGTLLSRLGGPR